MNAKEFASRMKAEIEAIKAHGTAAIFTDNLITYLSNVQDAPSAEPSPAQLEQFKADLSVNLERAKHNLSSELEMFKSVILAGQNAIRTMVTINGGAAVAMLAFLGHLASIKSNTAIPGFALCLSFFVGGTLSGGLVSGGTYLTQWLYASSVEKVQKIGFAVNLVTILFGIASFFAFGLGAWWTYCAFVTAPLL